jgi:hypothetical protein
MGEEMVDRATLSPAEITASNTIASIRQSVHRRSLPLSTRHLRVEFPQMREHRGGIGAGALAFQECPRKNLRGQVL